MKVNVGVPQGSVSWNIIFLVYINDLPDNIKSQMRLFPEEGFLFAIVDGIERRQEKIEKKVLTTIGRHTSGKWYLNLTGWDNIFSKTQ